MRFVLATLLALVGFAANSLLCRAAMGAGRIDPASFTSIRLLSGAAALLLLARSAGGARSGSWASAAALFAYAVTFSFAYVTLPTGVGALLLFGAVQATMIGTGIASGERLPLLAWLGFLTAIAGLCFLTLPGVRSASPWGSVLMLASGASWGVYSLRGRRAGPPLPATADNFRRVAPFALLLGAGGLLRGGLHATAPGVALAATSGALTTGVGYVFWYTALPHLTATRAAMVQLAAPVLAAIGGVLLLGESPTLRMVASGAAILVGVAVAVLTTAPRRR
jgi:drug/metabolite transporter (DMT)-like permease